MHLPSEYRIDVIETFKALQKALNQLHTFITEQDISLPCWFQVPIGLPVSQTANDRDNIMALIQQCEYLDHQKPRDILVGAGLVAASADTLRAIQQLNQAKDNFKMAILALKAAKIPTTDPYLTTHFEQALDKRPAMTTQTLRKLGLPRLHLKQCYRKIPILPTRPNKVSWTWANTKAITRISTQEAEILLLKQGNDPGILLQLQKLRALSPNTPLAIVQELAPHLRTNLVLPTSTEETTRLMVKGPVPLFYPYESPLPLPFLRPPKEKQGKKLNRPIRSDVKLDPEPFLSAIRVHRYLSP